MPRKLVPICLRAEREESIVPKTKMYRTLCGAFVYMERGGRQNLLEIELIVCGEDYIVSKLGTFLYY